MPVRQADAKPKDRPGSELPSPTPVISAHPIILPGPGSHDSWVDRFA
jgi:hypothetical protein